MLIKCQHHDEQPGHDYLGIRRRCRRSPRPRHRRRRWIRRYRRRRRT